MEQVVYFKAKLDEIFRKEVAPGLYIDDLDHNIVQVITINSLRFDLEEGNWYVEGMGTVLKD